MIYLFILLLFHWDASSSPYKQGIRAASMVPKGKVFQKDGRDYKLKTLAGSKIDIEFKRDGSFEEATGNNLNRGDIFEPGLGLLSLNTVARMIEAKRIINVSRWTLDHDQKWGWVYEFLANEDNLESIVINAKTGKMISQQGVVNEN